MKIIIPMAGLGKRLGPLTQQKPKALVRLAHQRLLDHVLDTFQELEKSHALEYVFITGYRGEQIKEYMGQAHPNKKVTYFDQKELKGQSHAILCARDVISGPIIVTYCDTIIGIDLSFLSSRSAEGVVAVREINDPRTHGVAVVGLDNLVTKLVEKPKSMDNKLTLTGLYYFSEGAQLIEAIETQIQKGVSLNNEYYLADAINILLQNGMRIKTEKVSQWLDAGTPEAIFETNAVLLQQGVGNQIPVVFEKSNLFIPPVFIHESSYVENSLIGPNVAIGKNCSIRGSIIRNTVVDDRSKVTDMLLEDSLISTDCSIRHTPGRYILADCEEVRIHPASKKTNTS